MKNENTLRNELQTWLELETRVASNIPFSKEVSWDDIENVVRSPWGDYLLIPDYVTQSGEFVSFVDVMGDAVVIDQISSDGGCEPEDCELALHLVQKYKGVTLY